ncbi:hypothetical protein GWI33_018994 [Rhynchophorus ferrugineus]|uniref:Uncharacterized protein n=1 Tax=Rhynchophorus ferrugineus TaxID=354439 RepID=A0A834HVT3_RHYFE|nr:hypothetical protein GWI33_018994 [Rhynchophorus ferrugineus]
MSNFNALEASDYSDLFTTLYHCLITTSEITRQVHNTKRSILLREQCPYRPKEGNTAYVDNFNGSRDIINGSDITFSCRFDPFCWIFSKVTRSFPSKATRYQGYCLILSSVSREIRMWAVHNGFFSLFDEGTTPVTCRLSTLDLLEITCAVIPPSGRGWVIHGARGQC